MGGQGFQAEGTGQKQYGLLTSAGSAMPGAELVCVWGGGGEGWGCEVVRGQPRGEAWGHSLMLKGSGSPGGCQPGSDRVALKEKEEDHLSRDGQVCMRALGGWGPFQEDLRG